MNTRCSTCADQHLAAVRIPGHHHIEAIVCLTCGAVQPPPLRVAASSLPSTPDEPPAAH